MKGGNKRKPQIAAALSHLAMTFFFFDPHPSPLF